ALRERLGGAVLGVGEVDTALAVDDEVVGGVEALALVLRGQDAAVLAVGAVGGDGAAAHLAGDDLALGVDRQAVGLVGLFAEDGQRAVGRQLVDALVGD